MQRCSKGFTLVELLIVIAILAILASMVLFALAGAEGTAKEMRTQSTITKLHNLVMQKWESYRTRRVPVNAFQQEPFTDTNGNGQHDGSEAYQDLNSNGQYDIYRRPGVVMHRLSALRELMRMEMPDRMTDLQDGTVTPSVIGHPTNKMPAPSSWQNYRRAVPAGLSNDTYQGAECLFLIVTRGIDDPDVMEQFSPSEFGDKDGDGLKEFWDAWENPISFLRWAPGFESTLQDVSAPINEHDPFDPLQVHIPLNTSDPWFVAAPQKGKHPPIFPFIYSAGPDGIYDIITDGSSPIRYAVPPSMTPPIPPNNPYYFDGTDRIGTPTDLDGSGSIDTEDNITNHN